MRNYFTFDGVDSRSFGVYISGQGTFKAPARSYDAIEIPGRNGALLGMDSRLGNVELTYPAFIYSNFAENIAAFRAFLLSHKGYFKLKDSYHPDEFRLAYYPGPFEPDVTSANNAGSFDITFICKPQRYLESGEEVIELIPGQSETNTYTGNPASFVAQGGDQITSLQIPLRFYQDLHGYANPWPGGGGVNLLDPDNLETVTVNVGERFGHKYSGVGTYSIKAYATGTAGYVYARVLNTDGTWGPVYYVVANTTATAQTVTISAGQTLFIYNASAWTESASSELFNGWKVQVALSSTQPDQYYPYKNICPITGLTGLSVYVGPTQDPDDATTYNVDWSTQAGTVYHGTVDPVAGQLTVDRISVNLNPSAKSENANGYFWYTTAAAMGIGAISGLNAGLLCNRLAAISNISQTSAEGKIVFFANGIIRWKEQGSLSLADYSTYLANNPLQIVYELATPITYQLTPVQIAALLAGETFVWSSNNEEVTVEVASVIPTILENPTLFDALPFLRVYGTGILGIGSHTITITAADVYTDIDCEMMDCFKGSANKNQYVQFSGNDFPTLEPGVNGFSFSGITKVEVKPRWWSV